MGIESVPDCWARYIISYELHLLPSRSQLSIGIRDKFARVSWIVVELLLANVNATGAEAQGGV